ncbi:MAG: 6-bladed beta-propeller [Acidobacteria bacterium]|nr:6-bladed beta-propeller [Acidobacteriota bacterium]
MTAAALAMPGTATSASNKVPYHEVASWAPIPVPAAPEWEMNRIATNLKGARIYASRRADPPILEIDPASGKILKMWGEGMLVWPHGLYVDRDGFVWATDGTIGSPPQLKLNPRSELALRAERGQQVIKFTPDGRVVLTIGTKGVAGNGSDTFNAPSDVVVAPNGDVFVADGHGGDTNGRVVKFSRDGKFIKAWGRPGAGPGEFNAPHAIAIDSRGRVLVGDRSNNRIQLFNQDGQFLEEWKQFGAPSGIAIMPDDTMFVTNARRIVVGNARDGSVTGYIDDVQAEGITVDGHGNMYASEVFKRALKKFSRDVVRDSTK